MAGISVTAQENVVERRTTTVNALFVIRWAEEDSWVFCTTQSTIWWTVLQDVTGKWKLSAKLAKEILTLSGALMTHWDPSWGRGLASVADITALKRKKGPIFISRTFRVDGRCQFQVVPRERSVSDIPGHRPSYCLYRSVPSTNAGNFIVYCSLSYLNALPWFPISLTRYDRCILGVNIIDYLSVNFLVRVTMALWFSIPELVRPTGREVLVKPKAVGRIIKQWMRSV